MAKHTVILKGLNCANCAGKIEEEVSSIKGLRAQINLLREEMVVESDLPQTFLDHQKEIENIVLAHEPDLEVIVQDPLGTSPSRQKRELQQVESNSLIASLAPFHMELVQIVAASIFFAIGLFYPMQQTGRLVVYGLAYLIVGSSVIWAAIRSIQRGNFFSEQFLMSIATVGAFAIGEYPEGVAVMLFYQIGELFQDIAVGRSRKSIQALMQIRPDAANLLTEQGVEVVDPEVVRVGERILVRPGEKVPLDGLVVEGHASLDTAALTGESIPREVTIGSEVLSGCVNLNGIITVEVSREFRDSTVSKILELVEHASSNKAPTEQFIAKFARWYTPAVIFAALALAFLPMVFIRGAVFSDWLYRALIFLVVSCPCALVVSIPMSFFSGIGGASKRGILVKGSNYLEALYNVESVVFDKTGTLTTGEFAVTEISVEGVAQKKGMTKEQLLEWTALAEAHSNHPIALSVKKAYGANIDLSRIAEYEEVAGRGVHATVDGVSVQVGNVSLLPAHLKTENTLDEETALYVVIDGAYSGKIALEDALKPDAKKAMDELHALGISNTVLLTGDREGVAKRVASELGMKRVFAELLPADKVEKLEEILGQKTKGKEVAFVGDGINDAPVLARADVGIAMGGLGSDAAIEAADVVVMTDEPSKVATAIRIAKRTRTIVNQNIAFALGVKGLVLLLGALGMATMWEAVFADVGVTFIAVLNSMRVLKTEHL